MMQPLEEKDLITDYRSDSSPHFQPYIVNPDTTSDMVERLLYKRYDMCLGYKCFSQRITVHSKF